MKARKPLTHWTVAVTHFGEERRAAANLERQGFVHYLPEVYEWSARRTLFRPVLMFEGYVLIKLREGWQALSSTRGISRVLMQDCVPSRLRTEFVTQLRALEDERGVVSLSPRLRDADRVKFRAEGGSWSGLVGIVQGTPSVERVRVLLTLMGREVVGTFDPRALVAA